MLIRSSQLEVLVHVCHIGIVAVLAIIISRACMSFDKVDACPFIFYVASIDCFNLCCGLTYHSPHV